MQIIINHLTRMADRHICVAGLDLETNDHVRPVLAGSRIRAEQLRENGGVFEIGAIIELGAVRDVGSPPEVEDRLFRIDAAQHVRRLEATEYWQLVERSAKSTLRGLFGDDLEPVGPGLTIPVGGGTASLGCLRPRSQPRLYVNPEGKARVWLRDGDSEYNLSLTDVRFYGDDLGTPDSDTVVDAAERIRHGAEVILAVGFGRPYPPEEPRHWLQVNNVHFEDDPLGLRLG